MGLFGFGKKKNQQPEPATVPATKPDPVPADVKPYQRMYMHNGQWFVNPNYDPTAPKPAEVNVFGIDQDEEETDDENE